MDNQVELLEEKSQLNISPGKPNLLTRISQNKNPLGGHWGRGFLSLGRVWGEGF